MAKIIVSQQADDDFERIWLNIALDNDDAADRLLRAINVKIERLRIFPEIGRARDDLRPAARGLVHGSYLILYEYDAAHDVVTIITVVEGMRDLDRLF
ncbi:type II toxin-antitoxin system RelE/ParE family toxin [Novosphingobium sp. ERN07]|uniref:type II toxin-antitoxin system RelE/ParE family toxin n=1 Tax=Novosphingobium sp. ERN07 TaxID=2726187 RepID=UPI0014567094|nr:type II toxin-antitoxin system RelE/ParE family toxin [Novosphingobium sp. ERN07]NLR70326.1 type II toxin-antitoxin system RelE/ParE family toxin [Novosphingobium sp. ERN07]